ncbi:hypothetical protein BH11VER1_BH11VER1_13080 [soil metagenome]
MKTPTTTLAFALFWTATSIIAQSAPGFRIWTSTDGRTMEAGVLSIEGDSVKFQMKAGNQVAVPLSKLSPADQEYLKKTQASPVAAGAALPPVSDTPAPAAEKTWPRSVGIEDSPQVETVKEDATTKEFIYRSPHYEFICDSKLGANVVREFGRMFEATYLINVKLPLDLKPSPEPLRTLFQARLFTEKDDYMKAGGVPGSGGVYQSGKKALMVPLSSLGVKMVGSRVSLEKNNDDDNAVLIHEITHQMMNHWLRHLPTWYIEGSAEYMTMLDYNRGGRFSLAGMSRNLQGYAKRRDWDGGGKTFTMGDIEELMNIDGARWSAALSGSAGSANRNYGSAGLLSYYFYHLDGAGDAANIIAFLREVENGKSKEEDAAAVKKHLLRDRSYAQLADDVKKALRKEGLDITYKAPGKNGSASASN